MPSLPSAFLEAFVPVADPERSAALIKYPIAHRGLHGGDVVENSWAAFEAAIAAGHGIECDVQSAIDGTPFVFHDATLKRLTGQEGNLIEMTPLQLDKVELNNGAGQIMRLEDLLNLVAGRVPLFIEIKVGTQFRNEFMRRIRSMLEGYRGPVAIMSFHPLVVRWFRARAPYIVRGLVVTEEGERGLRGDIRRLSAVRSCTPDFLAYDIRDLPSGMATEARKKGMALVSWTVRTEAEQETAKTNVDQPIYEQVLASE